MEEHVHSLEQRQQKTVARNINIPRGEAIVLLKGKVKKSTSDS